ncbi:DUF4249 domain-containing protein [Flavobacterium petrolei]|uniref:DUF4249 domain-containing protein n=1 Tax=Flavobacterium petrolei TaxID=2259594 RepID=A0A482TXV6_9FLAO|nr:DUF4249 domain-containing protein [Flavobacterium petrolei]RYJ52742.1 DUF4249 domain-containing protein [Flavobacterium petrolei]
MNKKKIQKFSLGKIIIALLILNILNSCSEAYNLQTDTYQEALVVEATITNEFIRQEIKISKTSQFEDEGIEKESGAIVIIEDDLGNTFPFEEKDDIYISKNPFKAESNREYTLKIETNEGKVFKSSSQKLTTENKILDIIPKLVTTKDNERGIQITVNNYDSTNSSKYYRYEYEETYKIVAPVWRQQKLVVTGQQEVALIPNSLETRICYKTQKSNDIILASTTNLQEDKVNLDIRFISDNDYIISHRYSIIVKQYVLSLESYSFRRTLKDLSTSSSIFSPKQPGFLNGNIKCISNTNEKVIGFFEVSSFSSKRIFFNHEDLFPNEPKPPYFTNCDEQEYKFCFGYSVPVCEGPLLISKIKGNTIAYSSNLSNSFYSVVPIECGDCTSFSSNLIPSFWID